MSVVTFHADLTCGSCGGRLEDDRTAVCHRCTAPDPATLAALAAPCPHNRCPHDMGTHGLDNYFEGSGLILVCCATDCRCGQPAPPAWQLWGTRELQARCMRCGKMHSDNPLSMYLPELCSNCWSKASKLLGQSASRFYAFVDRYRKGRTGHLMWTAAKWLEEAES